MEKDINEYKENNTKNKKNKNKNKNNNKNIKDPLLNKIYNLLPNELIDIIKSYMPYEIYCDLLEARYNPHLLIKNFNSKYITKIINVIYNTPNSFDHIITNELITKYTIFYDTEHIDTNSIEFGKIKRTIKDKKIFLTFLLVLYKYFNPYILLRFYKLIIIASKHKYINI